jgi:hypothetical protein
MLCRRFRLRLRLRLGLRLRLRLRLIANRLVIKRMLAFLYCCWGVAIAIAVAIVSGVVVLSNLFSLFSVGQRLKSPPHFLQLDTVGGVAVFVMSRAMRYCGGDRHLKL